MFGCYGHYHDNSDKSVEYRFQNRIFYSNDKEILFDEIQEEATISDTTKLYEDEWYNINTLLTSKGIDINKEV